MNVMPMLTFSTIERYNISLSPRALSNAVQSLTSIITILQFVIACSGLPPVPATTTTWTGSSSLRKVNVPVHLRDSPQTSWFR